MDTRTLRRSLGRAASVGLVAGIFLFSASAALAGTIGLTFNGPSDSAGKQWGVSSSSASAAQNAGVGILQAPLFSADGNLKVTKQDLSSINLNSNQLSTPFEVSSDWTTQAQRNLKGSEVFLVFTSIDPRTIKVNGKQRDVNYDPSQVGLKLDSSQGWFLLQTASPTLGTIYYPAIRLGPLKEGKNKGVDVPYFLQQLISCNPNCSDVGSTLASQGSTSGGKGGGKGNKTVVPLPKLRIAVAFAPIPEPGTALLLVAGLIGLAARKRTQ
jgi:PEP-CTERM motif